MPSRNCFVLLALLPCALALVSGCKEDQPPASLTQPERPFLYEADFARTPTLAARQDQVVVVDLEPTGGAQATAEDLARYELEAGMYRFCIEKDDPYLEHLRLENGDGQAAVDLDASAECVDVHLDAGTYRLRLRHRGADISGAHRVAFVHRLSPRPTLLGDGGVPRTGWWALAPNDPTGKLRPGRLHAQPPPRPVGTNKNFYQAAEPIVADFSSQQIDQSALFSFRNLGGSFADDGPLVRSGMYPLDVTIFSQMEASSTFIADTKQTRVGFKFTEFALQIVELGNQKVQLQEKPTFYPYTNFFIDVDNVIKWDNKSPNLPDLTAQVLFRTSFVGDPDYAQNVPGEGEIAVYENCNYTGQVTIFALDTPDLSALSGPGFALYGAIASVRSGHNTVAVLHSEANFGGTTVTVAESPCLDGTPVGRNTRSLQPSPALPIFIASSSCENCDLSGLDLTGVSVSGADLRGANLSGATLNRTILREARSLVGTSFDGAAITCSDFSGTEQALVDLTQTDLFTTTFSPDISSCRSNFSNTKVNVASLNPAALRLLDLTHATITLSATPLAVDLSGASWNRATVTDGGSLQGTHLANASLDGGTLRGIDMRGVVLSGATLNGADLTGNPIDGSNLVGAHFQGATLLDVTGFNTVVSAGADFTGAHLGGAGFVQAILEEVTLDGATFQPGTDLSGSRFNRSSLQGVDLSGLALYGATFNEANLTNSNLARALLSNNPDAGIMAPADFTGAHLKDVNLSGAQLQGTVFHFASFYGSFNAIAKGPPVLPCETDVTKCPSTKGFTCSCASAAGATMTRTDFSNAFLYGVDFARSETTINGVDFSNAILVGASFDGASFDVDPTHGGAQPKFPGAFLQGTNFGAASLDNTSFANAYVDFEPGGNNMQVLLGPSYTGFNGWQPANQPVCVKLDYTSFVTTVPVTTSNTICPDGLVHGGGCGNTPPRPNPNPFWASPIAIGQASPSGYYVNNATYTQADQSQSCNEGSASFGW